MVNAWLLQPRGWSATGSAAHLTPGALAFHLPVSLALWQVRPEGVQRPCVPHGGGGASPRTPIALLFRSCRLGLLPWPCIGPLHLPPSHYPPPYCSPSPCLDAVNRPLGGHWPVQDGKDSHPQRQFRKWRCCLCLGYFALCFQCLSRCPPTQLGF